VLGVLLFNSNFETLQAVYASTARGTLTLPELLHLPSGVVVAGVAQLAVWMFAGAEWVQRRRPS
jgi:hypothetical protein